jgi:ubiquinone biosynthesis protein
LQNAGVDLAGMISDLPEIARAATRVLEDGGFDLHLRTDELAPLLSRAERLGNRIAASVLAAAAIDAIAQLAGRTGRAKSRHAGGVRFR